jgi:hypothetical protein
MRPSRAAAKSHDARSSRRARWGDEQVEAKVESKRDAKYKDAKEIHCESM